MQSKSDGTYTFRGVPAGTYALTATMSGFASYVRQAVKVGDAPLTINIKMALATTTTTVTVSTDDNTVSVDPEKNAGGITLTAKDLEAFSDDPDELSDELSALAGPAAGPNGGQIYIDGFTGGQLPPKSSIREIRINQNPFSAEYDRPGFGRIEIFTKPGTDKFHGNFQINGQDKAFNTGSPYIGNASQPPYHSILTFDSISGPLTKKASFTANGSYRQIQNNNIVDPQALYSTAANPSVLCAPGSTATGCTVISNYSFAQFEPQTRFDLGPRLDFALSEKNTVTVRFSYEHNSQQNLGIDGSALPSTGYNETSSELTLQVSDTQIISSKLINETRFEFQRPTTNTTPFQTGPTIIVQGAFSGGGSSGQTTNDVQPHFEVQNYTSYALTKHFIKFGGRLRSTADTNTTTAGSNGTFVYSSIGNYQNNILANYSIYSIKNPTVKVTSVDLGVYAEDDWKVKPTLTFSYGLRYETQNYISDHSDFAPRLAVAYGVGKKTVLRAGFGLFYDRFLPQSQLAVSRNNGINEQEYTLSATAKAAITTACTPSTPGSCPATAGNSALTVQTIAPNLRAPYQIQENLGVDQQLFRNATVSINYQHILGVHQFFSTVPNALSFSTAQPIDYTQNLIYEYQSEGSFNQNQLIVNTNIRNLHGVTLFGYYVLNFAKSDASGISSFASNPTNVKADYGRASFDVRNRLFLGGSITLPHLVSFAPFIVAQSGQPYNITYGDQPFIGNVKIADNIQNYRAVQVAPGTVAPAGDLVKTIAGCGTFATPDPNASYGTTEGPINACTGPALFTANVRLSKTFGFGPSSSPRPDRGQGGGPGGPPGGGRGPGGPGGGGRGGGGGFGGGGGANSGKRYNLTIGVQAQNLFNIVDRGTPVGTLSSPKFGQFTNLSNGIYTTDSAVRRISLQAGFSF